MKVKPYFKTTLAESYKGKFLHEKGASVVMNTNVRTKSIGNFIVIIPDPVSLNLNNAQNFIEKCEKLKERVNSSKQYMVFSNILTEESVRGLTPEAIKKLDPVAEIFRSLNNDKIFEYMQSSMGVVVSLITAIESFVNRIIPHDYAVEKINNKNEKEILDKSKIVRKFSIEDKLRLIAKIKNKPDIKQQSFWSTFKVIKDLRDEVTHFKNTDQKVNLIWNPIIVSFFDDDLQKFFYDTVSLINYLEPKYLEVV